MDHFQFIDIKNSVTFKDWGGGGSDSQIHDMFFFPFLFFVNLLVLGSVNHLEATM